MLRFGNITNINTYKVTSALDVYLAADGQQSEGDENVSDAMGGPVCEEWGQENVQVVTP
jgi:hypothetical protein